MNLCTADGRLVGVRSEGTTTNQTTTVSVSVLRAPGVSFKESERSKGAESLSASALPERFDASPTPMRLPLPLPLETHEMIHEMIIMLKNRKSRGKKGTRAASRFVCTPVLCGVAKTSRECECLIN